MVSGPENKDILIRGSLHNAQQPDFFIFHAERSYFAF